MKIKTFIITIAVSLCIPTFYSHAETLNDEIQIEEIDTEIEESINEDTLPPPSEELIEENLWQESSQDPEENNEEVEPSSQDEPESWAIVDQNGNTINTIICDADFCGSGWIPIAYDGFTPTEFARVVRQSQRDPETGNYNSGHWGQYNFSSETWTEVRQDGGTYQIPEEYGSAPICLENCPEVIQDPNDPNPEGLTPEDIAAQYDEQPVTETENFVDTTPKYTTVKALSSGKSFSFMYKTHLKKNIKFKKVWAIATNSKEKKVWKFAVKKKNRVKISIPVKYSDWNISVNYRLKNNKVVKKKILLKN